MLASLSYSLGMRRLGLLSWSTSLLILLELVPSVVKAQITAANCTDEDNWSWVSVFALLVVSLASGRAFLKKAKDN